MVDTAQRSTPAYTVKIGEFEMNIPSGPYPNEYNEDSGLGQPNPTRISWSKTYDVAIHKIPSPAWKTMQTSRKTLWNLDIDFTILDKDNMEEIISIVNQNEPVYVRTYFQSLWMYIQSFSANAEAGYVDSRWLCTIKLIEVND